MDNNDSSRYFTEYENLEVHEIMLKDKPRQEAYYNAVMNNAALFKDKIVLDVGAGTGILSAFCAKAGAKLVYAVEASNLAKLAVQVIAENNLTPIVKVIHSKIEDFVLPPSAEKADIIISEWMGFYLLHEGMLDSVLFARDNFLKPGGILLPSEAEIIVAPCAVPSRFDAWNDVNGIKMSKFASMLRQQNASKPEIQNISADDLLHEGVVMHWIKLDEVTHAELEEINFKDVIATQRAGKHQGFCLWFNCRFPDENDENCTILSTSPAAESTHWKQCIVVLPDEGCEEVEENTPIAFSISIKRNNTDRRKYNLEVELLDSYVEEHPMPCDCHMTKCIVAKSYLQTMQ